jgi:hypothetical protein
MAKSWPTPFVSAKVTAMNCVRPLVFVVPCIAGCAHEHLAHVTGPQPDSPCVRSCLRYLVSNFSTNDTNHFYVGALHRGGFEAFVYWKEERTIWEYNELEPDAEGKEPMAFHHWLKLDKDTVDTQEEIGGSNYLVTHRVWVDWMEQCLSRGREYVITLEEARRLSPKRKIPGDI